MSVANWLTARGKTLPEDERRWLKRAAEVTESVFPAQCNIVNIGIFRYATMYCLRAGASKAKMYGIDIKKPDVVPDRALKAMTIVADSTQYCEEFDADIHLLFIDGDHHYEGVKADIAGWYPKVVPGGIIAFHDYAPTSYHLQLLPMLEGVRRAVSEWQAEAQWEPLRVTGSLQAYRRPQ